LTTVALDGFRSLPQMPIDRAGRYTSQKQHSRWDVVQAQRQFHPGRPSDT
jgi:hypothetical protein